MKVNFLILEQVSTRILLSVIRSREHLLASMFHSDLKAISVVKEKDRIANIKDGVRWNYFRFTSLTFAILSFFPSFVLSFSLALYVTRRYCLSHQSSPENELPENVLLRAASLEK